MADTVIPPSETERAADIPVRQPPSVTTYLFASDANAQLHRRPVDVWRLVTATVAFVLVAWAASNEPPIDARVAELFVSIPGWLSLFAWVGYTGSALGALGLIIACIVRGGFRSGVVRDLLLTLVAGIAVGLISGRVVNGAWPDLLPELRDHVEPQPYPPLRPAMVVAVILVLSPYLTHPIRRFGRWVMGVVVLSSILLGITSVTGALGVMALGALSVAVVRVVLGSPEGLLPLSRLNATLERVGVSTTELAYLPHQPSTVGLATARDSEGRTLSIKVYGKDAADRQRAERVWKSLWYKDSGPAASSNPVQRVEHEALACMHARLAGVAVPTVVQAGQDEGGDVVLVVIEPEGTRLGDMAEDALDDDMLRAVWGALETLHDHRQTHASLKANTILIAPDGPAFTDLGHSSLLPTAHQYGADTAALLALTAIAAGAERATDAAQQSIPRDRLIAALPYMQDAVVEPSLRASLRHAKVKLDNVRSLLIQKLGVEEPKLAEIHRVKLQDIVVVAFAFVAVNAIIGQIAEIGWSTLVDEVKGASVGWLIAALIIKLLGYAAPWIGLNAVVTQPVPLGPSMLEQSAGSFVGLVVPSTVGRVAMDTRYLQKLGVPTASAVAQGPVISFIGFLVEVCLLLLTSWALGQAIDTTSGGGDVGGRSGTLLVVGGVVVIIGLGVVFGVPKIRNKVVPQIKTAYNEVKTIITSPSRLGKIAFSELLERIFAALALAAVVTAFGAHLSFAALIFVSVGTGLLAGLAPVPGGVGVAEATMTALLLAVGLSSEQAFSIAIIYRVLTSYLPPLLGFFSLKWLKKHAYI